jgi:beta-phosphoglucomutase-like phosphatase (HAD superfamily)
MKDKLILTDCDGVILDWEYAFDSWMRRHGYSIKQHFCYSMEIKYGLGSQETKRLVRMFNESASIRKLPPLRDAIKYVRKLHEEHGYIFHAITSLSDDVYSQHLRTKNLIEMFGASVFEKYVYLDTGADKYDALSEYRDSQCVWIEDKPENVDVGISLNLRGMLMSHEHNASYEGGAIRVRNWREIYSHIVGDVL